MYLKFSNLAQRYHLDIKGVIHIGAHFGEEFETYKEQNIEHMAFFEPQQSAFTQLQNKVPVSNTVKLFKTALGNQRGTVQMFTEQKNEGQSSSVLEPEMHLKLHPSIVFNDTETVDMVLLDDFLNKDLASEHFNFINIDVQGYELEVLKGASRFLQHIDYIYSEVNLTNVYKDCALVSDLDEYLSQFGFVRVEVQWVRNFGWGDAFYIKKSAIRLKGHRNSPYQKS